MASRNRCCSSTTQLSQLSLVWTSILEDGYWSSWISSSSKASSVETLTTLIADWQLGFAISEETMSICSPISDFYTQFFFLIWTISLETYWIYRSISFISVVFYSTWIYSSSLIPAWFVTFRHFCSKLATASRNSCFYALPLILLYIFASLVKVCSIGSSFSIFIGIV